MSKAAVALSGGIDSAVTALLLQQQGFDVIGITGKMTCSEDSDKIAENAKRVADKIGIEHYVVDTTLEFSKNVIQYFENSYKQGLTPNPCIMCNKHIKWGTLYDYAINKLGADFVATGHYADIRFENGFYKLHPATDENKDQLYFLFLLDQEHLAHTRFPLNGLTKAEVRKIAEKYDLPPKSSKESQDICFIKAPMTTKKYLNNIMSSSKGNFVEQSTNRVLGTHDGYWQYTIGQRKGIGLAAPEALYVTGIDAQTNTVYVGYRNELFTDSFILKEIQWSYPQSRKSFEVLVKIRYNMKAVKASVEEVAEGWKIVFAEPVSALTHGQAAVFYDINDGHLLGGGWV